MEYVRFVSQIVAAERNAQEIAQEAQAQEASLESRLAQETEDLRQHYNARARARIDQVQQTETAAAAQDMALWDEKLAVALAAVEASYAKNKQAWVDTLFQMIVGRQA